jgi:glucose-6-phosphate 1-dehydrogenase
MDIPSFIMVIYGATGDLTKRKLIPALFSLYIRNLLPHEFRILAFARRPYTTTESFLETLRPFVVLEENDTIESWRLFSNHIEYVQGDFSSIESFTHLRDVIHSTEKSMGECLSKLYYMAVAPDVLPGIIDSIGATGLHIGCGEEGKWTRIIFEKPFGEDLESAIALDARIKKFFGEEQIYRIDHYLGKETVQNIMSVRFANILMQPVWCRDYIDHIQITVSESLGVEERGGYYDKSGALRDIVQNHLLQIVALITMDEPEKYDADTIRAQKYKIFKALRPMTREDIAYNSVRGQYVSAPKSEGVSYVDEERVARDSTTETYVALRTFIDLPQWKDVPIYLRTGKRMKERVASVHIVFKKAQADVFSNLFCELRSNTLTIRIQPDEGIFLKMLIKEPGLGMRLQDVHLDYSYSDTYNHLPDAYERLLIDCMVGDQSLFTRSDEIESMWAYVTNILKLWRSGEVPLVSYSSGTWGPIEAASLLHRDGKHWVE